MDQSHRHNDATAQASPLIEQKISVLHVEDDDFDAALVQRNLKRCDHAKFEITRGKTLSEGLYKLSDEQFDVILLDLQLPDGQGLESVAKFHDAAKKTPLIILTGNEKNNTPAEFVELGVQDFLPKATIDGNILHHSIRYAILRKEKEKTLKTLSQHDELTGLLNRKIIYDRITHAILRHRRSQAKLAVLYIDVDEFKSINDTFGHSAGDALLKHVAESLRFCVRKDDSVARMGGDEFVVLLENLRDFTDLRVIINKIVDQTFSPFDLNGEKIFAQLSIGVSTYNGAGDENAQADILLEQADFCMYRAKQTKGSHFEIFDQTLCAQQHMREALTQLTEHSFDRAQFRVSYAPITQAPEGSLHGAQAQLTWVHRTNEHLLTADLLSLVEKMSVAKTMGEWFLQEALQEWKTYVCGGNIDEVSTEAGDGPSCAQAKLFLNLPPKFLYDSRALASIEQSIQQVGFDPKCLVIEMYGKDLVNHLSLAREMSALFKDQLGISVCLADFGGHHCSLALLQDITCDYLRLGHCFFSEPENFNRSVIIATEIQMMSKRLGLKVLAPDNCPQNLHSTLSDAGIILFQNKA